MSFSSSSSSSGPGGAPQHSYDLSGRSLTELYNSPVYKAERFRRPLAGLVQVGPISHTGVRVTLCDGTQWLVHKGGDYGVDSQTVVVDAKHMSSEWKLEETKVFDGRKTVSDFVKAGGEFYHWLVDNCHLASGRMMDQ
ncbi:hypothetical protein INR49_007975 [Caranx melampygus]|nr:hypothetical protein INR49_008000 [Caranx melampygus]KAG7218235.1 hypothetical protein INR49_020544 [Caranx melampygus]KAG7232907.1 hypothetical protein INR49_007975 [Caranx melampygus]